MYDVLSALSSFILNFALLERMAIERVPTVLIGREDVAKVRYSK